VSQDVRPERIFRRIRIPRGHLAVPRLFALREVSMPSFEGGSESTIENAFVEAYNAVVSKDSSFVEEFLQDYEEVLAKGSVKE
jgi:broad specificity phosphatase PhoE